MKRLFIAIALVVFSPQAFAEKLSLGWMDIQPCSKTERDNRGTFGAPTATVRRGQERATLFLEISAPNFQRVQDELKHCAEYGVAAATLDALLKNLPGAAPAFWAEFQVCTRYTEWLNADLFVETSCHTTLP